MAPITTGGLGLPERGAIVTQGLGLSGDEEPPEPEPAPTMASRSSRVVPFPGSLFDLHLARLREEEELLLTL
jgi:hypothetical protein